ncbi:MAG: hypothetical protein RRZ24_04830 [Clostridia bacterium]
MDILFLLIAIGWIVLSAVGKKKKQQQQEEAKQQAPIFTPTGESGTAVPPLGVPIVVEKPYDPYAPISDPIETPAAAAGSIPAAQQDLQSMRSAPLHRHSAPPQTRMHEAFGSQLSEIQQSTGHTLEVSGTMGHAHEETSLTGVVEKCPSKLSERTPQNSATSVSRSTVNIAFQWDQDAVLQGIVMSEILGKPKSMRSGAR